MNIDVQVLTEFIAVFMIIIAGALLFWKKTDGFKIVIPLIVLAASLYFWSILLNDGFQKNRYISKDEARAVKMFQQNCKQVNFIQSNETSGLGIGMTGKGSPVLGTVSSSNEDSYFYVCDEGVKYNLTYDIEKYRKFYP